RGRDGHRPRSGNRTRCRARRGLAPCGLTLAEGLALAGTGRDRGGPRRIRRLPGGCLALAERRRRSCRRARHRGRTRPEFGRGHLPRRIGLRAGPGLRTDAVHRRVAATRPPAELAVARLPLRVDARAGRLPALLLRAHAAQVTPGRTVARTLAAMLALRRRAVGFGAAVMARPDRRRAVGNAMEVRIRRIAVTAGVP